MSGEYLIDTNIVIALFAMKYKSFVYLKKIILCLFLLMLSENCFMEQAKSYRVLENTNKINQFSADNTILNCDNKTAKIYGEVKTNLIKKGKPIPENDIWISSIAIQHDLVLITRDNHFKEVNNLKLLF